MTTTPNNESPDLVWGCAAIAKAIGRSQRATFHLLENELLPARRVGGRWCASRRKLLDALVGNEYRAEEQTDTGNRGRGADVLAAAWRQRTDPA